MLDAPVIRAKDNPGLLTWAFILGGLATAGAIYWLSAGSSAPSSDEHAQARATAESWLAKQKFAQGREVEWRGTVKNKNGSFNVDFLIGGEDGRVVVSSTGITFIPGM